MSNPILYQGIIALLVVLFLVMIYFFTRTWGWLHIVFVVLIFFTSIFFLRISAAYYRTVDVWRTEVFKTRAQLKTLTDEYQKLAFGSVDDTSQTVESIRLLRAKLGRVTMDQGRIWRNCTPTGPMRPDGSIEVSTVPAAPPDAPVDPTAAPAPAAPAAPAAATSSAPNLIQDQTVLYVFLESAPPADMGAPPGKVMPFYFVGPFVSVSATASTVTLKPFKPLSKFDTAFVQQNLTWALYETMPNDGHEWFSVDPEQKPDWNKPANEAPVFGATNAKITELFAWPRFNQSAFANPNEFQLAAKRVAAVTETYLRDGKGVANKDEFNPMNVWSKVRFIKGKTFVVDSGAKVSPFVPGVTDDFYDRSGTAEVAVLQLGQPAELKENDVCIFPQEDAQKLIDEGTCKFEEYVFVRRLNDYSYLFRNLDQRFDRVADDIDKTRRDIGELQLAQASIGTQLTLANDERTKIQQDLTRTQYEAAKIAEYLNVLEKKWADIQAQLSNLYRANLQLENELKRRNQDLSAGTSRIRAPAIAGN